MPNNPSYVRLVDRLTGGICADLDSGWSISGYDVKQFPKNENQQRFVRSKLHEGVLEAASKAEYDEIQNANQEFAEAQFNEADLAQRMNLSTWQENKVREHSAAVRENLNEARAKDAADSTYDPILGRQNSLLDRDADAETDEDRRQGLIDEAEERGLNTDDPEEQIARSGGQVPRTKSKKAAKNARKAVAAQRETTTPEDDTDDDE